MFYRLRSPLELLPLFDSQRYVQQMDWILALLSDCLKHRLEIDSRREVPDFVRGIEQFSDEQTGLGLLQSIKIMQ